jgi:uncharacterized protein YggE
MILINETHLQPEILKMFVDLRLRRIAVIAFLLAAPFALLRAQGAPAAAPSILATSGQGEAKVTPDRASVSVNVQTRATTAAAASTENAVKTRAVLDALTKLGLTRDQLSTESYIVSPETQYDRVSGITRVIGYVVVNSVRAETSHPDQAGSIVDAALGAGANMINGLSFFASSIDEARRQAITSAVTNARADAEAMARAAGGSLGALVELSTTGPTVPPRPMYSMVSRAMSAEASVPTPVNPGQQTVTVTVVARWQFAAAH